MDKIVTLKRGVSLVENMAALLVFSTAALGWVVLSGTLSRATTESEVASQGTVIADSLVNEYTAMKFEANPLPGEENPDLTDLAANVLNRYFSATGDEVDADDPDVFYTASVDITLLEELDPKQADVAITVSWLDSGFFEEKPSAEDDVLTYVELVFSRTVER